MSAADSSSGSVFAGSGILNSLEVEDVAALCVVLVVVVATLDELSSLVVVTDEEERVACSETSGFGSVGRTNSCKKGTRKCWFKNKNENRENWSWTKS